MQINFKYFLTMSERSLSFDDTDVDEFIEEEENINTN